MIYSQTEEVRLFDLKFNFYSVLIKKLNKSQIFKHKKYYILLNFGKVYQRNISGIKTLT